MDFYFEKFTHILRDSFLICCQNRDL